MCTGSDRLRTSSSSLLRTSGTTMANLTVDVDDSFSTLLELAADNNLDGFKRSIDRCPSSVDEIGLWYCRKKLSNLMVMEPRTPLMVAATYGSLDVLRFIISVSAADVNRRCGPDKTTALHCAASGGTANAVDSVKILLLGGADPNLVDSDGFRPCDVIVLSPNLTDMKFALEGLLGCANCDHGVGIGGLRMSTSTTSSSNSPPLSSCPDEEDGSSSSDSTSSPVIGKFQDLPQLYVREKKEYPIDPSLPDIKNGIFSSDEFRMFSFKVRPCSRAYSHDWTECPFVHPGENARRRDPRKFHYSCVPCPDFRKGACRRADLCEYAHGVFECWLHPAQYRTRLCKDGTSCNRRVCFFAHTPEELRPLFVSTGSAAPSPRSTAAAMEMAMNMMPCSPSSVSLASPSPFTPPMSPSTNGASLYSIGWQQPNVPPTLHLAGGSLQSSRLRSSLNARDVPVDELSMFGGLSCLSSDPRRFGSLSANGNGQSRSIAPSNLDDLFSAEITPSPRYNSDQGAIFSPTHKSAVFNQFQQKQTLLSPINTTIFSPKAVDSGNRPSLMQAASFGISSPRSMEPLSPISSRLATLAHREKLHQLQHSFSLREVGGNMSTLVGSPVNSSFSRWESNSSDHQQPGRVRRSNSFEHVGNGEEPDFSWVHSLVKDTSPDVKDKSAIVTTSSAGSNPNSIPQAEDHTVLEAWLEHMHLDQPN